MRVLTVLTAILIFSEIHAFDFSHSAWTSVLQKYVVVKGPIGQVKYRELKNNPSGLDAYLKQLQGVKEREFKGWNKQQQYVFWVNAYNAFTVKLIVDNYPVKSIKKLGSLFRSPWKKRFFALLGKQRHLDEIEHDILRAQFSEPRTHFALNCASIGCPALLGEAYTAKKMERQLEQQTKVFLRDTSRNKISGKQVVVSKIFDWFKEDFAKNEQSVQKFIAPYITDDPAIQAKLRRGEFAISYSTYDWNLNVIQ